MIDVSNLNCYFGAKQALKDVSLSVQKGEVLNILGANGSGKTTFLRCILGLENYKGEIKIHSQIIKDLSPKQIAKLCSYVPQSSYIPYDFSVFDIVLMGRFAGSFYRYSNLDIKLAQEALNKVGISHLGNDIFRRLSGGQKQLVLVARALAGQTEIILLDEPINGLDLQNQTLLLDLIKRLSSEGYTVVCTTHYPEHAIKTATKIAWLQKGELIALGSPKDVITTKRIAEIYGVKSEFVKDGFGDEHLIILG